MVVFSASRNGDGTRDFVPGLVEVDGVAVARVTGFRLGYGWLYSLAVYSVMFLAYLGLLGYSLWYSVIYHVDFVDVWCFRSFVTPFVRSDYEFDALFPSLRVVFVATLTLHMLRYSRDVSVVVRLSKLSWTDCVAATPAVVCILVCLRSAPTSDRATYGAVIAVIQWLAVSANATLLSTAISVAAYPRGGLDAVGVVHVSLLTCVSHSVAGLPWFAFTLMWMCGFFAKRRYYSALPGDTASREAMSAMSSACLRLGLPTPRSAAVVHELFSTSGASKGLRAFALVGDRAASLVIAKAVLAAGRDVSDANLLSDAVTNKRLGQIYTEHLSDLFGSRSQSVRATVVEAIVGSVYEEYGEAPVSVFLRSIAAPELNWSLN